MGDVKPPSGGTGDSGVLLLIHESGSNFSDGLETLLRMTTISIFQCRTRLPHQGARSRKRRQDRGWSVFLTRWERRRRSEAKRGHRWQGKNFEWDDQMMASCTEDAQHAVWGAR